MHHLTWGELSASATGALQTPVLTNSASFWWGAQSQARPGWACSPRPALLLTVILRQEASRLLGEGEAQVLLRVTPMCLSAASPKKAGSANDPLGGGWHSLPGNKRQTAAYGRRFQARVRRPVCPEHLGQNF